MKKQLLTVALLLSTNATLQAYVREMPGQEIAYQKWVKSGGPQKEQAYLNEYTKALYAWERDGSHGRLINYINQHAKEYPLLTSSGPK